MQETQETWLQSLGWEDSPGGGQGNPLQYSCLENPMDREAWQATVHVVTKSQRRLKDLACTHPVVWDLGSDFLACAISLGQHLGLPVKFGHEFIIYLFRSK